MPPRERSSTRIAIAKPSPSAPEQVRRRHAAVGEDELAGRRACDPELRLEARDLEAGRVGLDDEGADAAVLRGRIGAGEDGVDVRDAGVRDEPLVAVQDVVVAVALRPSCASRPSPSPTPTPSARTRRASSPDASSGRKRSCCSSEPASLSASEPSSCTARITPEVAQTFETSSIAASASSGPGPGAAVALLEEEPEQALLAVQLDDVPGKLVRSRRSPRPAARFAPSRACARARAARAGRHRAAARRRSLPVTVCGACRETRHCDYPYTTYRSDRRRARDADPAHFAARRPSSSMPRSSSARSLAVKPSASASATQDSPSARSSARVARPWGEIEQHLAPVAGIAAALDQPCRLDLPDRVRHRLRPNVLERGEPARRQRPFAVDPRERRHLGGGKRPIAAIATDELPHHGPQVSGDLRDLGVGPDVSV